MQFVSTNNFFQKIFLSYLGALRGSPVGGGPPVEKRCSRKTGWEPLL